MKKLTTPLGIFGPYQEVQTLTDRYHCDGADLPFSVIGEGTIEDWVGDLPVAIAEVVVPKEVSMRQARLALLGAGLLPTVEAMIAGMTGVEGEAARIEWEFAAYLQRDWPLLIVLAGALGLTPEQVDNLFIQAAGI